MSCFFRAMDLVRLTITIPPEEVAEVQMTMGDVFVEMGKPGQAEETYGKVLAKHPRSSNVHFRHFSMLRFQFHPITITITIVIVIVHCHHHHHHRHHHRRHLHLLLCFLSWWN
jgi:hypothetical protein